ncbi:MAG: D-alanyl-D-alanine carboxypeptidase/D-alanyl-D-alanine-endopeptidase [Micropruina sp.]|uniref:D-alanyl-D-alanine carboxypeptidase/D-alanyl-D-alanine endopeptidase n=1 Tax=Micropruina sp. TaxID=2737536 RepID=UPI0039E25400
MATPRRSMLFSLVTLCSLGLLVVPTPADARPAAPAAVTDPDLAGKLDAVLKTSAVTKATVGVLVADSASGDELYSRSAATAISPASNMKLLTSAASLDLLGPEYRFDTRVYAPATPSADGTVSSLYLRGNGDPTLLESDLKSLAAQLKAAGVRRVSGAVIGDGGYFDNDKYNDYWNPNDYNSSYAAQISGLTLSPSSAFKVGTIQVTYKPGSKTGKKAVLGVVPATAAGYLKLVNKTTTTKAGSGASVGVRRSNGTNTVTVSGRVALKRSTVAATVTISNPARYVAHVFRNVLRASGIVVDGSATTGSLPTARVSLASDTSVPLSTIVRTLMKPSNNGMTEHLIKTLGRSGDKAGTWKAGSARVLSWLKSTQSVPSTVQIVDGSGLAHRNKLTAQVLVRVLQYARTRTWFGIFHDALPLAGNADPAIGGTLSSRMRGTPAQNNLRAKTGTLSGVTALSGYVSDTTGQLYTFSMLGRYTGTSPRPVFDKVGAALAGWNR